MSKYYNGRRTRNLFDPQSKTPFKLSRSKIELFINCPRCFYLDRKLGVGQPPGFPFALNSAVDKLLKKEFDFYRMQQKAHPLMEASGIKAVPFKHEKMDYWRDALRGGIEYLPLRLTFCSPGALMTFGPRLTGRFLLWIIRALPKMKP